MQNVIVNKNQIDEVLDRGVEHIFPDRESLRKVLMSGKRIRLYCGFDPSAPSLHIGNAIALNKLSQFQALGHDVIFLIGDFTGMIGDPTDKTSTRQKLTREQVNENAQMYKKQASAYLDFSGDNPAQIRRNSEWSDPITFKDLIEISSNFTVQQMIQRDMFQARLKEEKPIYLHEFLYPLAQGYDSVGMDVDLEVGGNDQMFNMMAGRHLMKAIKGKEKFVMTLKLLADESGKKMGKTEGNAVFLDQTPQNIFGSVMAWTDGLIALGFELATKVSMEKVAEVKKRLADGENPRNLKMELAKEMVCLVHGEVAAQEAEEYFVKTFSKKEVPDEMIELKPTAYDLLSILVESKCVTSKTDARRVVSQNGVKVNQETASDVNAVLKPGDVIQKGKTFFLRVK
ncbi:MAG: Tyrosine-tRNA ligase [Candidatus Falkowbacteria bacterium GW2011_GWC2_38_22]|uniref:Tyrosine--tRNA ligase n=1 Tax=Candidatus Falkowbacteria bacterium GW2011_GWE1_38_31 TaxID=1618638 RepID=A0A0G0JXD1_9BACT|nr:MAG: Tyrosine-tRNA ligase [Candidatus Falkowbacteria bacterium GW2011_GWF2_38_1205]KKQ61818.1 MAG: Tyrosine-tRNA ligase [Candidatus Falkowbacteria bacterium GW2011_GWC2_38_22]KKQ64126.1 MAG: Tyrosine-tRNA ligase [Candidatus Falkowbacteria bacterium GW2011_GWF1_38_22]KKQ66524.1 MAG: Tyrosine-tRNA ligase [Candidatus Falkowbacteria bacterium GW2011_GWE2_38_254]KKQ71232.1 MAG: Tyrosine-tRNA ligase [Candidatus Falkowbacteria bacterium GW2011_GWE1_38_31]KKQ73360.1 MAG: Tyrosine-tRNA ligase [Candi